jgi:hypothetical protein
MVVVVASALGSPEELPMIRIQKAPQKPVRRPVELDLRTPSGRRLPY